MWPSLAALGKVLALKGDEETLFYYDTQGPGKPAIMLIHGLGDEADSWRHLIPRLRPYYRVLALDLPGFGRSRTRSSSSLKQHTQAVLRLLEKTGPAVLVGSSMGGIIAEAGAFARPDRVKGLILLDGCLPTGRSLDPRRMLSALPWVGKQWYRRLRTDHHAAYRSLYGYYGDLAGLPEADQQFLWERVIARVDSPTQERAYFGTLRSLLWTHLWGVSRFSTRIRTFPGFILILWGEKDRILPLHTADTLRSLRPDAEYRLIPGAGHLPHQERPEETAEAILALCGARLQLR
jgi:pimeloyl-ACP methyl ester carboxylesterase